MSFLGLELEIIYFRVFAIWEIGFEKMAVEKLNFGNTDIQEYRFWEIGIREIRSRKNGLPGGKY